MARKAAPAESTPASASPVQGGNPRHSIPAAVRPAKSAAIDDFDSLGDDGATTIKTPGKKADRPEVPLPPEVVDYFRKYAEAKVLNDIVAERAKNCEAEVDRAVFDLWQESLWKHKAQPTNPALKLEKDGHPDIEALFQVQDKFTKNNIHLPEPAEGQPLRDAAVAFMVELGMPQDAVEAFLDNEVEMRPVKSLRPFNELLFGHYEGKDYKEATEQEKAVAQKMMDFVKTLPPEERKLVLVTQPQITVKKGVIGRVPVYAKSLAHVKTIFQVFTPVHFVGKAKVGLSDTPAERVERLAKVASEIIGAAEPDVK